jgi:hypothetical protein
MRKTMASDVANDEIKLEIPYVGCEVTWISLDSRPETGCLGSASLSFLYVGLTRRSMTTVVGSGRWVLRSAS